MLESLEDFFSTARFMPHGHCYLWKPTLVWTMVSSDLLIGLAYVSISLCLYSIVRKIRLPFSGMFLAFGLFIAACGTTHFMEVYTLWVPLYGISAIVKAITATASVVTAIYVFPVMPQVIDLAKAAQLSDERQKKLEAQTKALSDINNALQQEANERKRVETELLESEERLKHLVEGVRDYAIFIVDTKGYVLSWNLGAERIIGYDAKEIIGKHLSVFYRPQDMTPDKAESALESASREGRFAEEGWRVRKNGTQFWASAMLTPLYSGTGKILGFTKITRDLTEIKKFEDDLKSQARALTAANKELEAFSYSVSHDLRAPLRSMAGFSQALLDDYSSCLDEKGQGYLRRVINASHRMEQLIEGLLSLSQIRTQKIPQTAVNLTNIANDVIAQLQAIHPQRHVSFVASNDVIAHGDNQLFQVLLENLLGNAWKFTSGRPNAKIEFGMIEKEGKPVYFIRDNGVGFNMDYANKLFTPFQRLHSSEEFEGSGIGLATVQRIIRLHGGRIWVEAAEQQGAAFYFTL